MSNADLLRVAAHHLLAAARPSNPNPTPSTLAAALAMSQAGLVVTNVRAVMPPQVAVADIAIVVAGPTAAAVYPGWKRTGAVGIWLAAHPHSAIPYNDADALTAALRALLEGQ